jgi:hypothetical protein
LMWGSVEVSSLLMALTASGVTAMVRVNTMASSRWAMPFADYAAARWFGDAGLEYR